MRSQLKLRPKRSRLVASAGLAVFLILFLTGLAPAQSDPPATGPRASVPDEESEEEEASEEEEKEFAELATLVRDGKDDQVRQRALAILAEIEQDEETGPPEIAGYFALLEEAIGADHPAFGFILNDYGRRRLRARDYPEAWRALDRSLAVHRERLDPGDLALASILQDLARALDGLGLPVRAQRARRHRLAIMVRAVDMADPNDAGLRADLAATYLLAGAPETALNHALRAESVARRYFERQSGEDSAVAYEEVRRRAIGVALGVLTSGRDGSPAEEPEEAPEEEAPAADSEGSEAGEPAVAGEREPDEESDEQSGELATAPAEEPEQGETVRASAVRHVWDEVIRSRRTALDWTAPVGPAAHPRDAAIGLSRVAAALPADAALIAYVRYDRVTNEPPPEGVAPGPRPSYLALALPVGSTEPEAIPLADATEIDPLIATVRKLAVMVPGDRPGVDAVAGATYVDAATALREAIWDPVAPTAAGARRLFIVPDGEISLVSFAALPVDQDRFLVEDGPLLHYLSAERDLVRASHRGSHTGGLLAIGAPDFDAEIEARPGSEGARASCPDLLSLAFDAVPGSRDEAKKIVDLWKKAPRGGEGDEDPSIKLLVDERATEEALRELAPGHAVLHFGTRSFFAPQSCRSILDAVPSAIDPSDAAVPADGVGEPPKEETGTPADGPPQGIEREPAAPDAPLMLSGIALAGANRALKGEVPAGQGDGILTAAEIAALDLSGIEWAVLDASGSDLNGASCGARVDDLRRAFERAGAGTLIMSLWPVAPERSLPWLERLYEGRLAGLETAEAMRSASVALLEAHRESGRSLLPIDWAAYVAAGDWR